MNGSQKSAESDQNRHYWESESVADHLEELEPVEIEAKPPLAHTLSVRVAAEDLRKLRELGRQDGVGTTTMARVLLRQALRQPCPRAQEAALRDRAVPYETQMMPEEERVPPRESDPAIYFFSNERIKRISTLMEKAAANALAEFLREIGRIAPDNADYARLKEKEGELGERA